jgi:hypothetical protein
MGTGSLYFPEGISDGWNLRLTGALNSSFLGTTTLGVWRDQRSGSRRIPRARLKAKQLNFGTRSVRVFIVPCLAAVRQ